MDLTWWKETIAKLNSGEYSLEGEINLACCLGEKAHLLVAELERLQQESMIKVTCATHGSRTFGLCSACVNAEEARKALEADSELDALMAVFDAAKDSHPFLFIEIGYTKVTDWMVHVWDAHGTSIANAPKIISTQSPSRSEACRMATEQLRALTV